MSSQTSREQEKYLRSLISRDDHGAYFGVTQEVFDRVWANLTSPKGESAVYISMEIGADQDVYNPVVIQLQAIGATGSSDPVVDNAVKQFLFGPKKLPNYSGGLGILAGDTLKSMADCHIPVVAVSLLYRKGYFTQLVDSKVGQIAWSPPWEPERTAGLYLLKSPQNPDKPLVVEVPFIDREGQTINAYPQVWLHMEISKDLDFFVPKLLLDYSGPESPEWISRTAEKLYDSSSEEVKAIQRRMLGAGILPVLRAFGVTSRTLHLNEQHGVVVVLHMIAEHLAQLLGPDYADRATDQDIRQAATAVGERIVYTIHTPVKAGHDRFPKTLYSELGHNFCRKILNLLASDEDNPSLFNFTALAMRVNRATNSVSRLHKEVTRAQFPQYAGKISAITNGIHHLTWISSAKAKLFDSFPAFDKWRDDPGVFANAASLVGDEKFRTALDNAWLEDTQRLIKHVNDMLLRHRHLMVETWIDPPNFFSHLSEKEGRLDPKVFTLGFARRFSTYKRADLIFADLRQLADIVLAHGRPVNFLFAGKAHPADESGKALIKLILAAQKELYEITSGLAKLVFVPGYDMELAKLMVAGVHAWLNNPKRPLEASGTSGMKAAVNAVPNISILDGWWAEGYHNGKTGWKFGSEEPVEADKLSEDQAALQYAEDSAQFYSLFPIILEEFYDPEKRPAYLEKCTMNLALNTPIFNTHRMVAEYLARYQLALPAKVEKKMVYLRKLYQSDPDAA